MSLIAFDDISCVRGGRMLFEHISFSLEPGAALVISGRNGIGKSSLLRIAAGLLRPFSGAVRGEALRGYLGEAHALDPERTLANALLFWARIDGADETNVAEALEAVGLSHIGEVPVRLLSTGQRRRAALAPLLASKAPVWLLDEPASGLDTAAVAQLAMLIAKHRADGGTVLVATHQLIDLPGSQTLLLGEAA